MGQHAQKSVVFRDSLSADAGESVSESGVACLDEAQESPELLELIGNDDSRAANDDDYRAPAPPPEFGDSVAAGLVRGLLWWAFFVCIGISAFAFVLR